jgi:7-cyano-7-deazaguanine synthase in queuosine biosynthesis
MKQKTVLVMLSGGLDSCYMLYYYLTQTDHAIHAHHISLRYPSEPRWKEEDIASRKIVEYCRSIRAFDYSESRFEIGFKRYVGRDSDTQLLVAAKVAPNLRGEVHLAIGWEKSDFDLEVNRQRAKNKVTENLWNALCDSIDYPLGEHISRKILFPLIEMDLDKSQMIAALPDELVDMTWSCRRPKKDEHGITHYCGVCKPCRTISAAREIV